MLADPYPGYLIYCSARPGCLDRVNSDPWTPFGGTSAGAPLLAGSFALVDAELRTHGYPNLGFANPLLYKIARSKLRPCVFRDVRIGSNDVFAATGHGVGCCSAKRGFDPGLGAGQRQRRRADVRRGGRDAPLRPADGPRSAPARTRCAHGSVARHRLLLPRVPVPRLHQDPDRRRSWPDHGPEPPAYPSPAGQLDGHDRAPPRGAGEDRYARCATTDRVTAYLYAAIVDPTGKIEHHTHGAKLRPRR